MRLFGLKNCDTCRKALKSLEDAEFVDVRTDGVPHSVLRDALARFGDDLVNRRSTTWRQMSETERRKPPLELISEVPTVMKRPLIEAGGELYLGWSAQTREALGLG